MGETMATQDVLMEELKSCNRNRFKNGLECYSVIDNMWSLNAAKQAVECGIKQETAGTFRVNNPANKLENALAGAWQVDEYWKKSPSLYISVIKVALDEYIKRKMRSEGRIKISDIYNYLKKEPYGFMPCNLSAFVMGFLLKEYYGGKYTWSDETTSDELTIEKMKEMIDEVLKLENTPNNRYKDKYIVTLTPEEKSFIDATSIAFGISKTQCSSIEAARDRIRVKMKELSFPIWTLLYILEKEELASDIEAISSLIKLYGSLANNEKEESGKSENDIAIEIGKICLKYSESANDLRKIFTTEKCLEGITAFLDIYREAMLPFLAKNIKDGNQYVNVLRNKFDADAANWVWRKETAEKVIDDVILEYQIVEASNNLICTCKSYNEVLEAWSSKVGNMKLTFNSIKNDVGELKNLLENLYQISQIGRLHEQNKSLFLDNLHNYGTDFVDFYNNKQFQIFKKVCDFELNGLNEADKEKLFRSIPMGCFTKDKADYITMISHLVEDLKKGLSSIKLKEIWQEKTGTSSPYQWSVQNKMPILAMLAEEEVSQCRKIFDIINATNPDTKDVTLALSFLERTICLDKLKDVTHCNNMFIKNVLGENAVLLDDVDEVKNYLSEQITDSPYYWMGLPAVKICLEKMAEAKYNRDGYEIAFKKIDVMSPEDVKRYLKDLIRNNKNVGIEIIKNS